MERVHCCRCVFDRSVASGKACSRVRNVHVCMKRCWSGLITDARRGGAYSSGGQLRQTVFSPPSRAPSSLVRHFLKLLRFCELFKFESTAVVLGCVGNPLCPRADRSMVGGEQGWRRYFDGLVRPWEAASDAPGLAGAFFLAFLYGTEAKQKNRAINIQS